MYYARIQEAVQIAKKIGGLSDAFWKSRPVSTLKLEELTQLRLTSGFRTTALTVIH